MHFLNQPKFFIVDDDNFCANVYEQFLKNLSYTDVTYFNSGEKCLDHLHLRPNIIFLDHNMDELSGFEVLKKIKRYDPNIYVVMVSAQESISTAVEALKFGAFDYLVKDANVCDNMGVTIQKIIDINNEISKSNYWGLRKLFNMF